jgi:acetylornithine deacetylase/succinyl-diaminopimelate desuccinylase-like protein
MAKPMEFTPKMLDEILDLAVRIQQIPAPTFEEAERAAFVHKCFIDEGLADVSLDELGNVYACMPGRGAARPLVISAHTDTVFPRQTDLNVQRTPTQISGPGIGDNSLGVAGLFGLVWAARAHQWQPAGDTWLVANVCEEGLGDLRGMRAVVDRLGAAVCGYIVLEGMAFGHIYHRGLGVTRYRIACHTQGGHSWTNFGRPSAIHELARIVPALEKVLTANQTYRARLPLPAPRSSLNVGIIKGGTSVNTIAAEAYLELDLRSESEDILSSMSEGVQKVLAAADRKDFGAADQAIHFTLEQIGRRPSGQIPLDHPLLIAARQALEAQGTPPVIGIGSTDANVPLSLGIPAVTIGLSTGGGAHTLQEFIHTAPLAKGMTQVSSLLESLENMPGN